MKRKQENERTNQRPKLKILLQILFMAFRIAYAQSASSLSCFVAQIDEKKREKHETMNNNIYSNCSEMPAKIIYD